MQRCTGMATVINNELQTQCGGADQSWMENVFQYQLICANTKDTILAYDNAIQTARNSMSERRDNGEIITVQHQTRILQDAIADLNSDCDTMTCVVFSWAHTSVEGKSFIPTKAQHLKGWRLGQEYFLHVQGYHLELTATVLGLRPRDKDFHTLLNIVINDWAS
eukprot:5925519-Amphidinium_carterae.1